MGNLNPKKRSNYKVSLINTQEYLPDKHSYKGSRSKRSIYKRYLFSLSVIVLVLYVFYWVVLSGRSFSLKTYLPEIMKVSRMEGPLFIYSLPEISLDSYKDSLTPSARASISSTLRTGQTLEELLTSLGFSNDMVQPVKEALKDLKDEGSAKNVFKAGSKINVYFDLKDGIESISLQVDSSSELLIKRTGPGVFKASIGSTPAVTKERIVVGSIDTSFANSALKQGMSYDMVDDLVDIFSDRVSFQRDFRKGDRFTVIFHEHEVGDGSKTIPGPILGAALEVKGEHLIAIRYVGEDGKARYFNERSEEIGNTFLRYPLKFSKISSYFSTARFHPVLKVKRPHNGVDFSAPIGTPVRSVASGVVEFAGRKGGFGVIVEIRHSDRFTTGYAHLSSIQKGLTRGDKVSKGEVIGAVGMTGLATGPHLHFSLYDKGVYVDPLRTDLPLSEETKKGNKIDDRYLKRALLTLKHFQDVANNSILGNS